MTKIIFLLLTILFSFTVKGQGLYFDSIIPPHVKFNNNTLELTISYREYKKNKIKVEVNVAKKEIILSAKSLLETYSSVKRIVDLKRYKISDLAQFQVYWLDPDNRKHLLMVHSEVKPYYSTAVFPFREGEKWYYVDSNFNKLSADFDFVLPFNGNYAVVKINEKYALINKSMTLLTQAVFDEIDHQTQGAKKKEPWFSAVKYGKSLQIDTMGQKAFGQIFLTCGSGGRGHYRTVTTYKQDGRMGLLKELFPQKTKASRYDTITPAIYDTISRILFEYKENLWLVKMKGKLGVLDHGGNELLPVIYDEMRIGWNNGGDSLPIIYNSIRTFEYNAKWYNPEKEMLVCIDSKCGFIDRNFSLFTELKYKNALPFNLGFSLVETPDGKWGYIDRQGREFWR